MADDITTCQTFSTPDKYYKLLNNVNSSGTCFTIQANNVTLNGNGFLVNYSNAGAAAHGVKVEGGNFSRIENFTIREMVVGAGSGKYGIFFQGASNGTARYNNISTYCSTNCHGVTLSPDAVNNTLVGNNITTYNSSANGIRITSNSNLNKFINNTITTFSTSANGMYFDSSDNFEISNNTITTSNNDGVGIYITGDSDNGLVDDNTVVTSGTNSFGIYILTTSDGTRVYNNEVTTSGAGANSVYLNGNGGIVSHSLFVNNTITSQNTGEGIYLLGGAGGTSNSTFINNFVLTSSSESYAFEIFNGVNSFQMFNCTLNASESTTEELYILTSSAGGEYNFTNVTRSDGSDFSINWSGAAVGTLNLHWYLDLYIKDKRGAVIASADVDVTDNVSKNVISSSTNSNGFVGGGLQEYQRSGSGGSSYTYYSNYTANASKTGYFESEEEFNLTGNEEVNLTLDWNNSAPTQLNPILNSTDNPNNISNANLTAYNQSTSDSDGDVVKNIFNWFVDSISITILNMPFEANNGSEASTTKDHSGNDKNGTVISATWNISGGFDGEGCYEFDSSSSYVYLGNDSIFSFTDGAGNDEAFSVSAWVYFTGFSGVRTIVGKYNDNPREWIMFYTNDFIEFVLFTDTPNWIGRAAPFNSSEFNGKWAYVTATYNGNESSSGVKIYINGTQKDNETREGGSYTGMSNTVSNVTIGARYSSGSPESFFGGKIDEVVVYNRSLSAEQVNALYNNRTDLIVSQETNGGETWSVNITPNDGYQDGEPLKSNDLSVQGIAPVVSLVYPAPEASLTGPKVWFIYNVTDDDSGIANCSLIINGQVNATNDNVSVGVNQTFYDILIYANGTYNWSVNCTDDGPTHEVTASETRNFTVGVDMNVFLTLNPSLVDTGETYYAQGRVNFTDGTNVTNHPINIFINGTPLSGENWWGGEWSYRNELEVESTVSSSLYNVTTLVNFSTSDKISEGKMNSDCSDVRFVNSNGVELNYTLETSTCDTTNTIFWVWSNLTGSSNNSIDVYYGNSGASLETAYTVTDPALFLLMHLDNSSAYGENDNNIFDFSRNGYNGTPTGGPFYNASGKFGGAYQFDGQNDYVVMGNMGASPEYGSYSFWMYPTDATGNKVVFTTYVAGDWEGDAALRVQQNTDDLVVYWGNQAAGFYSQGIQSNIEMNTWYHVVVSWRIGGAMDGDLYVYLDGNLKVSRPGDRRFPVTFTNVGFGGSYNGDTVGYYKGKIDEVRMYSRQLTLDEIRAIYTYTTTHDTGSSAFTKTNGTGHFNYSFSAPSVGGVYPIKVNATVNPSAEDEENLTVNEIGTITDIDANDATPEINNSIFLNWSLSDADGLSHTWLQIQNSSGTANTTPQLLTGTSDSANFTYFVADSIDTVLNITAFANDSGNRNFSSNVLQLTVSDYTDPIVTDIDVNDTTPEKTDYIFINWTLTDETNLSHTWLQIQNSTGSYNLSVTSLSETSGAANHTYYVNDPVGTNINFTVYVNDTKNNIGSSTSQANVTDLTDPNSSDIDANDTNPNNGDVIFLNWTLYDDYNLSHTWLQIQNSTGSYNVSFTSISGTEDTSNYSYTVNDPLDTILNFTAFVNDTSNNIANSSVLQITVNDTLAPALSNFRFYSLNSSRGLIGNESSFNVTNLEAIEYMVINFTVTDSVGIFGDIGLFYTANGTSGCSLGNNQSSQCYAHPDFIEFRNNTITSTFDAVNANQGDNINCTYQGNANERNYTCKIDEHYNPNVWKHYPMNFSDLKWQSGNTERIKRNTVWKIEFDTGIVPLDADYYKLDFRVDNTNNPTQPILAYLCNSTYNSGDPSISPYCQLVASKLPSQMQDDGTKFRALFTKNLTNDLGDIRYVLLTSDSPTSRYYSLKTYLYLGTDTIRSNISNDGGDTYSVLSDGYETELNINWFYDQVDSNKTQIIFKVEGNDSNGNIGNSSEQVLTWNLLDQNLGPIVDIIIPEIDSNVSGNIQINWTTADSNGDVYFTNITISNSSDTISIVENLSYLISNYSYNSINLSFGVYNLTVESCENETTELYCGNSTHEINILDSSNPNSSAIQENNSNPKRNEQIFLNWTLYDDLILGWTWLQIQNSSGTFNVSFTSISGTEDTANYTYTVSDPDDTVLSFRAFVNDTYGNIGNSSLLQITVEDSTAGNIEFVNPTLPNNTVSRNTTIPINVSISNESEMKYFIFNWNGTNYTHYNDTDNSLVFMLSLNNISAIGENDTYAVDLSNYGNNCTFGNATAGTQPNWTTTGKHGSAVVFDGVDDFLNCTNDTSLNFTGNITIEAWINTKTIGKLRQRIVGKKNAFAFGISLDEVIFTGPHDNETVGANLQPNKWHHVAVTIDNINSSFYVDGVLNINQSYTDTLSTSNEPLTVGDAKQWSEEEFNGTIDEVRIYNRVLSPSEIQENYYSNVGKYDSDKWNFYMNRSGLTNGTYSYQGFVEDQYSNVNSTEVRYYTVDQVDPTVSTIETNDSSPAKTDQIYLNWTVYNGNALNTTWLKIQNSTGIYNVSYTAVSGAEDIANYTYTVNDAKGTVLNFTAFVNDSSGNNGSSTVLQITVGNAEPTQTNPILNATDHPVNRTTANLTAYNQSTTDIDGDSVKNIYNWIVNGTSNTVLNMPFEGNGGSESSSTNDYSGFNNDGTIINGTVWNSSGGYDGSGAYEFDGENDVIIIPSASGDDLNPPSDFSISVWFKASSNGGLIGKLNTDGTSIYSLRVNNYGFYFRVRNSTGDYTTLLNNSVSYNDSNWHHFVGVANSSAGAIYGYVDGENVGENDTYLGEMHQNGHNVTIGLDMDGVYLNGTIDEIIIFNRSLSAEQINALYTNRTDLIVSQETNENETWAVDITPNDGTDDGTTLRSNNVTIASDSCGCLTSGNWVMDCSDNCTLDSNCQMDGSNFSASGVGTFTLNANLTGINKAIVYGGCKLICQGGNCIR
ncbi:DUF2341 domain-containing protein [Nanoarchaeota archaeon]